MVVYEGTFPFEVDRDHESNSRLFPTLAAIRRAAPLLIAKALASGLDFDRVPLPGKPGLYVKVEVERLAVCRLTPTAFCDIINSRGGNWVEEFKNLDPIHFPVKG